MMTVKTMIRFTTARKHQSALLLALQLCPRGMNHLLFLDEVTSPSEDDTRADHNSEGQGDLASR